VTAALVLAMGSWQLHAARADDSNASGLRSASFEEIADSTAVRRGDRVSIAGRYVELRDDEIVLFGCPVRLMAASREVRRAVLRLSARHANLRLDAKRTSSQWESPVFEVQAVRPAPDSATLFAEETGRLAARPGATGELLFGVALRARRQAEESGDERLTSSVHEACEAAFRVAERRLPPNDVASRVALVERSLKVSGDRRFAAKLLTDLDRRFPGTRGIRDKFKELRCRRFRGEWQLYEDFKRAQGYEEYHDHWVSLREKDFLETMVGARRSGQRIIRNRTDAEYRVLADRGEIAMGMKSEEVYHALGFPDRVYREILNDREYDQWVYSRQYCYFRDGLLVRVTTRSPDGSSE